MKQGGRDKDETRGDRTNRENPKQSCGSKMGF